MVLFCKLFKIDGNVCKGYLGLHFSIKLRPVLIQMRNTYLLAIIIGLLLISCNAFESDPTIGVPLTFEGTFTINADSTNNYSYYGSSILDVTTSPEVQEQLEFVEEYRFENIRYLITGTNVSQSPIATSSFISIGDTTSMDSVFIQLDSIDLKSISAFKEEQVAEFSKEELLFMGELIQKDQKLMVNYHSEMDTVAEFTFKIILDLSAKVGI